MNVGFFQRGTFKQLDLNSWLLAKPPLVPSKVHHIEQDARTQMFEQLFGENCSASEGGDEFECDFEESDTTGQASSSKTKVGSKRKFRDSWRFYHPWVLPGSKDGQLVVKCNVCKAAKKRNTFATT